jgi:ABC-type glycerol-3-phosphate transport system permease component
MDMRLQAASSPAPAQPHRKPWRQYLGPISLYVLLAIFVVVTFAPIYWIILSAVTPIDQLFQVPLNYWPSHISAVNFQSVSGLVPLGTEFFNSAVLSVASAALTVVICLLAAYAFARIKFPGSNVLFLGILLSGFLPAVSTIIPLFQMFQTAGLIDTKTGLIILYVNLLLPTSVWFLASFVRQVPYEMEEAAQVDGAGFWTILFNIVTPVLRPALATLFLIDLITAWDEFFTPLIFSRSDATTTLTLGITQAATDPVHQQVIWGFEAAMGLIAIGPVFILALIFQKQIVEGLMAGALKG